MRCIAIIPARMASSRFPGKPLAPILGMPMLGHVFLRSRQSARVDGVYIATCDAEIMSYAASIGAPAIMTKNTHERCTDRTAEALLKIEEQTGERADIVVMIQGDEPMVTPEMIDAAVAAMEADPAVQVVNLMAPLATAEDHDDRNEPKVVCDLKGRALYFSREAIPSRWKLGTSVPAMKQVCIMPFRRDFLLAFNALEPTPLEVAESVDMMRVLEHGFDVQMVLSPTAATYSVDTPQDLAYVEELMRSDARVQGYHASYAQA